MTKKDIQLVMLICQFHFTKNPTYKDCCRNDLINKIKSLEDIWALLEVLGSSGSPYSLDDGVDVLCQIDANLLKKCLKNCNDIDTRCLYILIRAAGKQKNCHIFKDDILKRMHSPHVDAREAVAEALYDMGDIENLKQMSKKDKGKFIRELAKELLLEGNQ